MEKKLQQNINNFRHHLKVKKHKFQRDFKDFKSGKIFRQTNNHPKHRNNYRGSLSGETDWSDQDLPPQTRRRSQFKRNPDQTERNPHITNNKSIFKNSDKTVSFLDIPIPVDTDKPYGPTIPLPNPFFRTGSTPTTTGSIERQGSVGIQEPESPSETVTSNKIINLSDFSLSKHHITLLNKGLSFVPTPTYNMFNWSKDLNLFGRKLPLNILHAKKDQLMANEMGLSVQDYELSKTLDSLLAENYLSRPLTDFKPPSYFTPNFL
ncbi:Hypothetical predicted protein [Pelobates cultripes]|uniref:Uncharacterized protein n=1 Tax=Pelobates cultripes TaxID=61616 RepID=A0AAD1RNH5_PELCU|nr:Hypothetical predicted protein [Pelobates cultripes]